MLKENKYAEIEQIFESLLKIDVLDNEGYSGLSRIYERLAEESGILEFLNGWCNNAASRAAFTARGFYYVKYAWSARGPDYVYTVTDAMRKIFNERLFLAKSDLERACVLSIDDPNPHAELIRVAIGLNLAKEKMEEYFQGAINIDPLHWRAQDKRVYLMPKAWFLE